VPEKGKTFAGEVREETVAWSKDTYQLLKQAEQGKVKSYVQDIALAVLDCKETATSRETFIRLMNERGYGVDWQDSHKYITYTDLAREQAGEKVLWSSFFVTVMANKIKFILCLHNVPQTESYIHCRNVGGHDCRLHRQIPPRMNITRLLYDNNADISIRSLRYCSTVPSVRCHTDILLYSCFV